MNSMKFYVLIDELSQDIDGQMLKKDAKLKSTYTGELMNNKSKAIVCILK